MFVKEDGGIALCHLHIGDIVSFNTEEPGNSFVIIKKTITISPLSSSIG